MKSKIDYDDTDLLAYCMSYDDLRLKSLETQELNLWHPAIDDIIGRGETLADKPLEDVALYCNQDADATERLWRYLIANADERELGLYNTIEKPLLPALIAMEMRGIRVDLDYVREWDKQLAKKFDKVSGELERDYGLTADVLDKPQQLGEWLKGQGIKLPKTETGQQLATGKEILAAYIDKHPAIGLILQRRQYDKLRTTYANAYLTLTDKDGILHAQYNQTRVVTGRTSCSKPNLQNLPHVFEARRPFIAREGNALLDLDHSQVDMRVLAHYSQDKALLAAFERDEDVHDMMADMLFGNHDENHRYLVKSASYMMLFLGTPRGLFIYMNAPMGEFNIKKMGRPPTEAECEEHLQNYYKTFPGIPDYHKHTIAFAYEHGYVEDFWGRRRYLPKLASGNKGDRKSAEREAVNLPIAGTAAGIFKLSLINTYKISTPVMHVHDAITFDIPKDEVKVLQPKLTKAMLNIDFPVPLKVKAHVGQNLGELL